MSREQTDTQEIKDRLRRMETRLVKLFEHLGFDTERKKPTCKNGRIELPSMQTSVEDIMELMTPSYGISAAVFHKNKYVMTIKVEV